MKLLKEIMEKMKETNLVPTIEEVEAIRPSMGVSSFAPSGIFSMRPSYLARSPEYKLLFRTN